MSNTKTKEDLSLFRKKIIILVTVIMFIIATSVSLIYFTPKSKSNIPLKQGIMTTKPNFFQADLVDLHVHETFYGNQEYKIAKFSREFIDPIDETKKFYPDLDINGTLNEVFELYNEYPGAKIGETTYYYSSMSKINNEFENISDFDVRYFKESDVLFPSHKLHPIINEDVFISLNIKFDKEYDLELIDQKTNDSYFFNNSKGLNINYIKKDYIDGSGTNHKDIIYKITNQISSPIIDSNDFEFIEYSSNDFSENTGEYRIVYNEDSSLFLNNLYFSDKLVNFLN